MNFFQLKLNLVLPIIVIFVTFGDTSETKSVGQQVYELTDMSSSLKKELPINTDLSITSPIPQLLLNQQQSLTTSQSIDIPSITSSSVPLLTNSSHIVNLPGSSSASSTTSSANASMIDGEDELNVSYKQNNNRVDIIHVDSFGKGSTERIGGIILTSNMELPSPPSEINPSPRREQSLSPKSPHSPSSPLSPDGQSPTTPTPNARNIKSNIFGWKKCQNKSRESNENNTRKGGKVDKKVKKSQRSVKRHGSISSVPRCSALAEFLFNVLCCCCKRRIKKDLSITTTTGTRLSMNISSGRPGVGNSIVVEEKRPFVPGSLDDGKISKSVRKEWNGLSSLPPRSSSPNSSNLKKKNEAKKKTLNSKPHQGGPAGTLSRYSPPDIPRTTTIRFDQDILNRALSNSISFNEGPPHLEQVESRNYSLAKIGHRQTSYSTSQQENEPSDFKMTPMGTSSPLIEDVYIRDASYRDIPTMKVYLTPSLVAASPVEEFKVESKAPLRQLSIDPEISEDVIGIDSKLNFVSETTPQHQRVSSEPNPPLIQLNHDFITDVHRTRAYSSPVETVD